MPFHRLYLCNPCKRVSYGWNSWESVVKARVHLLRHPPFLKSEAEIGESHQSLPERAARKRWCRLCGTLFSYGGVGLVQRTSCPSLYHEREISRETSTFCTGNSFTKGGVVDTVVVAFSFILFPVVLSIAKVHSVWAWSSRTWLYFCAVRWLYWTKYWSVLFCPVVVVYKLQ